MELKKMSSRCHKPKWTPTSHVWEGTLLQFIVINEAAGRFTRS